jgi:BMFP domain-containing protein YqiC
MAEEAWIPLESDGKWAGGFCHLLRECLESTGVETDWVSYEGRTMGRLDQSATFLTVTVPVDPRVPEFKGIKVHYFESSTMEAHRVCARRALKEVCIQLGEKLKDTLFSILPMRVYDPSHLDMYDHAQYFEVTSEVEDKKMHMANRCILAQDHALYLADSEITYLRWKWDRCLQLAQELELEKLDLADRLEHSHQRNGELVQLGLAATRASAERDTVRIATLEARLKTAEEKHRATVEATRVDREKLAEAKYLMESVGAAAADYQVRVWDLQEGSRHNYNHLCYLCELVYEERDRAARTRTA